MFRCPINQLTSAHCPTAIKRHEPLGDSSVSTSWTPIQFFDPFYRLNEGDVAQTKSKAHSIVQRDISSSTSTNSVSKVGIHVSYDVGVHCALPEEKIVKRVSRSLRCWVMQQEQTPSCSMAKKVGHWIKGRSTQGSLSGTWHRQMWIHYDQQHAQDKQEYLVRVRLGRRIVRRARLS